ncbi:MAG: FkbM family methyltransferase [Phycisphaerales bacterium]|nr:FkbM family methyltransferase [Phycisphaerales bacterium]
MAVHTFDNGIKVHDEHLLELQRERYATCNLHEPEEEDWIRRIVGSLGERPCIVDVGAAIGYYSMLVRILRPDAEVHAYEPMAQQRAFLELNVALNEIEGIHVHPEAVGAAPGTASMVGEGFVAALHPKLPGDIPVTTLDEIASSLETPIDLVKIDIQGGEVDALRGATTAMRERRLRNWVVGTHAPRIHRMCLDLFQAQAHRIIFEAVRVKGQPDGIIVAATGKRTY